MVNSINSVYTGKDTSQKQHASDKSFSDLMNTSNDFLQLLIAQLKHQDPLNPMEGNEFIDSIARLSAVEQSIAQNSNLEKVVDLLEDSKNNFSNSLSYLNKKVEFYTDTVSYKDGEETSFSYYADNPSEDISLIISDLEGRVILKSDIEKGKAGRNDLFWDGTNQESKAVKEGLYKVEVVASSEMGKKKLPVVTTGLVKETSSEAAGIVLKTESGIRVFIDNVRLVGMN